MSIQEKAASLSNNAEQFVEQFNEHYERDVHSDPFIRAFAKGALKALAEEKSPADFFVRHFDDLKNEEQYRTWWSSSQQRRGCLPVARSDRPELLSYLQKGNLDQIRSVYRGEIDFEEQIKEGMKAEFDAVFSTVKDYLKQHTVQNERIVRE